MYVAHSDMSATSCRGRPPSHAGS